MTYNEQSKKNLRHIK